MANYASSQAVIQNEVMGQTYVRETTGSTGFGTADNPNASFTKSTSAYQNSAGSGYGTVLTSSGITNVITAEDIKTWQDQRVAAVVNLNNVTGYQLQLTLIPFNDPNGTLYASSIG